MGRVVSGELSCIRAGPVVTSLFLWAKTSSKLSIRMMERVCLLSREHRITSPQSISIHTYFHCMRCMVNWDLDFERGSGAGKVSEVLPYIPLMRLTV